MEATARNSKAAISRLWRKLRVLPAPLATPWCSVLVSTVAPKTSAAERGDQILSFIADIVEQTKFGEGVEVLLLSTTPLGEEDGQVQRAISVRPTNFRHVYFEVDPGLYTMWNEGWAAARGELITNLNLDDRLAHNALVRKLRFMKDRPVCNVLSSAVVVTSVFGETFDEARARDASVWWRAQDSWIRINNFFDWKMPKRTRDANNCSAPHGERKSVAGSKNVPHNSPMWRASLANKVGGAFNASLDPVSDWSAAGAPRLHPPRAALPGLHQGL